MLSFILLYSSEAFLRKIFGLGAAILLLKYFFLIPSIRIVWRPITLLLSLLLLPSLFFTSFLGIIPYAIYDSLGLLWFPLFILSFSSIHINAKHKFIIADAILISAVTSSLLMVTQFVVGPDHFLSSSVDSVSTNQVFRGFFKLPGLFAISTALPQISGFAIYRSQLSRSLLVPKFVNRSLFYLLLLSTFTINIVSRNFALQLLSFLSIYALVSAGLNLRRWSSSLAVRSSRLIPFGLLLVFLSFIVFLFSDQLIGLSSYLLSSRLIADFSSVTARIISIYPDFSININFLLLAQDGLGSTINNLPDELMKSLSYPSRLCGYDPRLTFPVLMIEGEFTRLICAFGLFGYFLFFSKFLCIAYLALLGLSRFSQKQVLSATLILFSSFLLLTGLQLKQNDNLAGIIILLVTAQLVLETKFISLGKRVGLPKSL